MKPSAKKAGNVPVKKVGHTVGTKYGTNPTAMERGKSTPSPIKFNG